MDNQLKISINEFQARYEFVRQFYDHKTIPRCPELTKFANVQELLNYLATLMLNDESITVVYYSLKPLVIELISRLLNDISIESKHLTSSMVPGSLVLNTISKILTFSNEVSIIAEFFMEREQFFKKLAANLRTINQDNLQVILLSFYRLVTNDREKFKKFVHPEILYAILNQETSNNVNRYLSIQLLQICLELAENVRNEMVILYLGEYSAKGCYEGDSGVDFHFLPLLEAQRLSNFTKFPQDIYFLKGEQLIISQADLSQDVVSICGVLIPTFTNVVPQQSLIVPVSKSLNTLKQLAKNVQTSKPTMLVGKSGSGKTFLINELVKLLRRDSNSSIVKIHLNDQTDAKILLGTYTSDSKPGSFVWKNGVLTTAVKEGKWVLIEDIDKAPTEVLSILLTLLEKNELTIPSRGEVIKAANGFQLISTVRLTNDSKEFTVPDMIGSRQWHSINLPDLDSDDLSSILEFKYPVLTNFLNQFLELFSKVSDIYNSRRFASLNKGSHPRPISARDLIKFCGRVNMILSSNGITDTNQLVTDEILDMIFQEATDCFVSSIREEIPLQLLISEIGHALKIPSSRIQLYLNRNVPSINDFGDALKIGRATLPKNNLRSLTKSLNSTAFARTSHSLKLMEQITVSVSMHEPVLLVGETGTGKTTVVQEIAKLLHKKLTVINVSQQTEVGDLLGGYKPVNTKSLALPIQESFEELFNKTFSLKKNAKFMSLLSKCFNKSQWKNVVRLWKEAHKMSANHLNKEIVNNEDEDTPKKKRRLNSPDKVKLMEQWDEFYNIIDNFEKQSMNMDTSFAFQFIEGALVKAVRNGDWLLLDEINLASPETLESIGDLLNEEIEQRNVLLSEKGDIESIKAHEDFRLFGCMNPSTDIGKRDLPASIRSKFTEIYVHSPDRDITDLLMIIDKYIGKFAVGDEWCGNDIAQLYIEAKSLADSNRIVDGANQKPHFSIRTLTRTLIYVCDIVAIYGLRRSLYEGFCMSFLTLLDVKSEELLKPLIEKYTIGRLKNSRSVMKQIPADPSNPEKAFVQFRHYWMKHGPMEVEAQPHYIITPFVEKNMLNLVRATSGRRFPVLIQGPTSSGKTSMINHLAKITGHKFVRINNHEHTDLQEYLGTYISDNTGKLVFKEGVLVEALRKGYWIVLDELNLAPSDVLEALNRLLDDNRELFIPETQEIVHPHPDFMLFATQNPPGLYGGRKVLSRAFRNRFLELHFDDIPQNELETILRERCQIAPSYGKKIVEVYRQLSIQRQATRFMEQNNSFATLRDLFRWAQREAVGYEQLAANGYMLLAERVRREDEKRVVKDVIETVMKVKLDMDSYYANLENDNLMKMESSIVWTKAMRRLSVLVTQALQNNEPLLLVGETGCGKTTICQLIAEFTGKRLISVSAHQNTETGDILGAQRPLRNRSELQSDISRRMTTILTENGILVPKSESYDGICQLFDSVAKFPETPAENLSHLKSLRQSANILFEWSDGPLVQALKEGDFFLLDEISLADDSVLERLNSVLEPERSLLLAEKGTEDAFITAQEGFKFLATMNPGGDYGKKELSPALRNRFTEIWVPSMDDFNDIRQIVNAKLFDSVKQLADALVLFSEWFGKKFGGGNLSNGVISLRDILAWVQFINNSFSFTGDADASLLHGACMVFIDALGTNNTAFLAEDETALAALKQECVDALSNFHNKNLRDYYVTEPEVDLGAEALRCGLFAIPRVLGTKTAPAFNLHAPTTAINAMRVTRAMQVHKPILLEGSPGVGKTSLVSALASATGNPLTRINLSEQTDLTDLFGSDAPTEGGDTGEFSWRDAPFLRAMKMGEWVLLDEMNLASQSVLEGLNACLDHRGEAYIPELDKSFPCHPKFSVFAAQNPQYQGGGRKGLPKSFVNRFSVVYVDMLKAKDLQMIAHHLYPAIDPSICSKLITFVSKLEEQVVFKRLWGLMGSPWEFNLRDTLRWLELINSKCITGTNDPSEFFDIIIGQRFRSSVDKQLAANIFAEVFGSLPEYKFAYVLGEKFLQAGHAVINREELLQYSSDHRMLPLRCMNGSLETVLTCINHSWPLIMTGPSGAGKTELIRFTASVVGAKVTEFSMNSEVDSMDILGGYEQVDLTRSIVSIWDNLKMALLQMIAINLTSRKSDARITSQALTFLAFIERETFTTDNFHKLKGQIDQFASVVPRNDTIVEIVEDAEALLLKITKSAKVKFEWFDGLLVRAVEQGHWLVLDNANLCSPSVLDRLNSLLEPNGVLIINECSDADGQPRVVKPHANFRLFLTVNPKYGELSRAMRNRGIELYLPDLEEGSTAFDKELMGLSSQLAEHDKGEEKGALSLKRVGLPLSSFISSADSMLCPFFTISDVINRSAIMGATSTTILTGALTHSCAQFIDIWASSVEASSEFCEEFASSSREICDEFEFLNSQGVTKRLKEFYEGSSRIVESILSDHVNFESFQSANPLFNVYLLPTLELEAQEVNSAEPFFLFETASNVKNGSVLLHNLVTKSMSGKPNELNFLERSAATAHGRNVKNVPRLKIYLLITGIFQFIESSLQYSTRTASVFKSKLFFGALFELYIIWKSLYQCSQNQNEARLRVYQQLIDSWTEKNEHLFNPELIGQLKSATSSFNSNLSLTRGASIEQIWEHFRSLYPSSEESWSQAERLKALAKKFDDISQEQFNETFDTINELRRTIVQLLSETTKESQSLDDAFFESLTQGIANLQEVSSRFLNKRVHLFKDDFDLLLAYNDTFGLYDMITNYTSSEYLELYHLGGRPTDLLTVAERGLFRPYPRVFDYFWRPENNFSAQKLFDNTLVQKVLHSACGFVGLSGVHIQHSLTDITKLGSALLQNSEALLADQFVIFRRLLVDWYLEMVAAHLEQNDFKTVKDLFDAQLSSVNLSVELMKVIEVTSKHVLFVTISRNFLIPAISTLFSDELTRETLGKAWILFSAGSIQLFVPNSAVDPAIGEYVSFEIQEKREQFLQSFSEAWNAFIEVSGVTVHHIPQADSPQIGKPKVLRPHESCDSLFEEWNAFMESSIDLDPIERLLAASNEYSARASQQVKLFQKNSTQFLSRLDSGYSRYADLNDILKGYILGLKFGFDLIVAASEDETKSLALTDNWSVDIISFSSPSKVSAVFEKVRTFCKSRAANDLNAERILIHFMRLYFIHLKAPYQSSTVLKEMVQDVFQNLYYRWTLRRMKAEEQAEQSGRLFKQKDFEVEAEEEFKELFPDYADVLTMEDEGVASENGQLEEVYFEIAQLYVSAFSSGKHTSFEKLLEQGVSLNAKLSMASDFQKGILDSTQLSLAIYQIAKTLKNYDVSNQQVDFYHGFSPAQTKRVTEIIEKIQGSASLLIQQWPEHETLQNIFRSATEMLSFPSNTPVAKLLAKVEQVYTFISQWEKYAHSKVSLKTEFDMLTQLIISWRQLELSAWKSLFDFEDKAIERHIGKWWFYLFETILIPLLPSEDKAGIDEVKLLEAVNLFLSQTTCGEFGYRLSLLEAFREHLNIIPDSSTLSNAISNIITFYKQFQPSIDSRITERKKVLEKSVNEVILLASWKDVNIDALKQSARRSHQSLYKIVRKYRSLLSEPITSIIEEGISSKVKCVVTGDHFPLQPPAFSKMEVTAVADSAMIIFPPNRNVFTIESNMKKYVIAFGAEKLPTIYDFCKELLGSMDHLKKETPTTISEETKKEVAALKTQKRKLLSDTLKELRRMGLKLQVSADVTKRQSSVNLVLAGMDKFDDTIIKGSDAFVFRFLDLLPRLRSAVSSCAEDVPASDAQKGLAVTENLLFSLVASRRQLLKLTTFVSDLEDIWKSFNYLAKHDNLDVDEIGTLKMHENTFKSYTYWLPIMCEYYINVVQSAEELSHVSAPIEIFENTKIKVADFTDRYTSVSFYLISTSEQKRIIDEFSAFLLDLISGLRSWGEKYTKHAFVADSFIKWITSNGYLAEQARISSITNSPEVSEIEQIFKRLINSIIISVQKIVEAQKALDLKEDEDNWFKDAQQKLAKYFQLLFGHRIISKLKRCLELTMSLRHDDEASPLSSYYFAILPFLGHYISLATFSLNKLRKNYVETSHGAFILASALYTLATEGFCSPQEPEDQSDSNNMQDGTGLGDGEGAKNNANDVEEDEDLTEYAQQPNEDQKEKDDDENDDAVDIEGDMAGDLEDAPAENSDEEGGEDEDEKELDEEIDDLDDLDPNAIDDKMWNEETQDDTKEKDSEQMPEDSKENDDLQANEDEETRDEDQKTSEENQQNAADKPEDPDSNSENEAEEEEDVGAQEDAVTNAEDEQLDPTAEDTEALELPDNMNLDSDHEEEQEDGEENDNDPADESFEEDANMDIDLDEEKNENDAEGEKDEEEAQAEEDVDMDATKEEAEGIEDKTDGNRDEGNEKGDESESDMEVEQMENETSEQNNANKDENAEGLDGLDDTMYDAETDQEASAKNENGQQGQGAETQTNDEQEDVGASGAHPQEQHENMESSTNDEARDMAAESFKQLGDTLKEFHRRRQEILEANDDEHVEQSAAEKPDEFQHLEGENSEKETQALGAATKDQVQTIDDDMAIDDDEDFNDDKVKDELVDEATIPKEETESVTDQDVQDAQDADGDANGQSKSAFIGERKRDDTEDSDAFNKIFEEKLEIDEEIDFPVLNELSEKQEFAPIDIEEARDLWRQSEIATQELSAGLCEQLRLILEPTLATKLKGDYKTGKRLNMKRIIPYIASQFRKDKIWLRRTKPSKRQYQIMISVDDSKSMAESNAVNLAFESIALVSKALTQLESGGLSIVKFGEEAKVVHPFDKPFTSESGAKVFQWFDFKQTKTDIKKLCDTSRKLFNESRSFGNDDLWQLEIIISDGVCEDHETIQRLVRKAREDKIMIVFVIIDGINSNESIMDMSQISYVPDENGKMVLQVDKYLDSFPFEFYVVVHKVSELPEMLSVILRQYFSELASA